jgi:hypothetical protein
VSGFQLQFVGFVIGFSDLPDKHLPFAFSELGWRPAVPFRVRLQEPKIRHQATDQFAEGFSTCSMTR